MDHTTVSSGTPGDKKLNGNSLNGGGGASGAGTASVGGSRKVSGVTKSKLSKLPTKLPTNIIRPSSFVDTLAILALLTHVPSVVMVIVHCFYVASFFGNSGLSSISTRAIFGWSSTYDYSYVSSSVSEAGSESGSGSKSKSKSESTNSDSNYYSNYSNYSNSSRKISQSLLLAIGKALLIDFSIAWTTLYIVPLLRNVVIVFAHAIVASSLGGGGQKIFTNAIYSTTLVEIVIFIWNKVYYYLVSDDFILPSSAGAVATAATGIASTVSSSPFPSPSHHNLRHLNSPHHLLFDDNFLSSAAGSILGDSTTHGSSRKSSFNTLSSLVNMVSSTIRFVRHMDWAHEFPIIFFQAVAVHVIGLGLVPFIRKVFPERGGVLDFNTSSVLLPSDSSSVDNTSSELFIDSTINFSCINDSNEFSVFNNNNANNNNSNTNNANGANPINKIISVPDYAKDLYEDTFDEDSFANYRADFDFLYAPSVKKNKRLATVRSNQPLWSILATSIALAARQETASTSLTEFELTFGQCSVRYILENMVAFEMVNYDPALVNNNNIFVRVNGIQWPQVSVQTITFDSDQGLLIIVYGLTPTSQYDMEVIYINNDEENNSEQVPITCMRVNISTSSRKSGSGININTPARPVSPVTTLLDTLTTTQMNLSEEKSRLKKSRKEHAKRLGNLRSEADSLKSKIEAADKGDERNNRKVLSLRELVRQMDEEIEKLSSATELLISQQEESLAEYETHKKEWENHMKNQQEKEESSNELKSNWAKRVQTLESDLNSLTTKCDKLEAKKQRLLGDIEELENEENSIVNKEIESRTSKRINKLSRRNKVEGEFSDNIMKLEKVVEETKRHTSELLASSTVATIYPQQLKYGIDE